MSNTDAPGMAEYQKLLSGGFSQQEAEQWKAQQTAKLMDGGFSNDEVNAYWGETPPDTTRLDNDTKAAVSTAGPKVADGPLQALEAGWQSSVSGLVLRGRNPDVIPSDKAGWMADALTASGQLAGDLVPGIVGAAIGSGVGAAAGSEVPVVGNATGAVVGGGIGAFAVPTAMRETLMDYYSHRNGGLYFKDFWTRFQHIATDTVKSGIEGGIAAPIGGKIGAKVLEKGGSAMASRLTDYVANATTATAVGGALDGHVPDKKDFTIAAGSALALALFTGGKAKFFKSRNPVDQATVQQNLQDIYAKTGIHPSEAVERAKTDPGFAQEIYAPRAATGDFVTPRADEVRNPEPDPYEKPNRSPDLTGLKNGGFAVHEEHQAMLDQLRADATKAAAEKTAPTIENVAQNAHLELIAQLEGSAAAAKVQGVPEAEVVSKAGAIGRYQIMPNTAKQYGFDPARLTNPEYNEKVARAITQDLASRFPNDTAAQLVAYNAGPGRARSWIANGRHVEQLPLETQRYLEHAQRLGAINEDFIGHNIDQQLVVQGDTGEWVPKAGGGGKGGGTEPPTLDGEVMPPEPGNKKITDETMKLGEDALAEKINEIIAQPEKGGRFDWLKPREMIAQFQSELEPASAIDRALNADKRDMSVEDMLRQTYASKERAGYFVRYGTLEPTLTEVKQTSDNSFIGAYKAVKEDGGDLNGFMAYRLAKRTIEKEAQGVKTGVDLEQAKRFVKLTGDKYERGASIMRKVKDASIDYAVKSGRFSPEFADALKDLNREHIVMRRVVDEGYHPTTGKLFRARNPIKKMYGSNKQIVDPITTEMDNLHSVIAEADRNRARLALVDKIIAHNEKTPEDSRIPIEKIELDDQGNKVLSGELLDENGHVIPPLAEKGAEPFIAERQLNSRLGPNDFVVYRNGKPEVWRSHDEALTDLLRTPMPTKVNPVVLAFQKFAGLQRAGIAAAVEFPVRVLIHSQIAHSAFAEKSSVPFHDMMAGMMDVFKQSENYKAWVRNGGAGVALSDMDVNYLQKDVGRIWQETGTGGAVLNAVKHPLDAMRMLQHQADAAARIGYMKRMDKLGYTPLKAAAMSRKAQLDFAERQTAAWVNTWAKMVPFMPSGIKDLEQVGRAMRDHPVSGLTKATIYFTLPTVMMYALNKEYDKGLAPDDPNRYDQLPRWERDMYWVTPPMGPNHVRIKIQKPYVGSYPFSTLPERMLDDMYAKDPHAMDEWSRAMIDEMIPPYVPSLAAPVVEQKFNKSLFTDRPLVPASLENASGYLQYTPNTSETAKKIAKILGPAGYNVADVSPIVLQNYARQWAGTMPMTILRVFEKPFRGPAKPEQIADNPFVGSFFVRHPDLSSQSIQDFFTDYDDVTKAHTDWRIALEHNDMGEINAASKDVRAFVQIGTFKTAITNQMKLLKTVEADPTMTPDEKRQYTDSVVTLMIDFAKAGSEIAQSLK